MPVRREQLEWIADEVVHAGATASIWLGRPGSAVQERSVAIGMAEAIAAEYRAAIEAASAATDVDVVERRRTLGRLRRELHRIGRRDHFPPIEREQARAAIRALGELAEAPW